MTREPDTLRERGLLSRLGVPVYCAVTIALGVLLATAARGANSSSTRDSQGVYRLPYADGTQVKVFADFITHTPPGRLDLYAAGGEKPYRVVAAAAGRIVAIQDSYSKQQDGRTAVVC